MPPLTGTVKNGQIVLDEAAELPEGTRVEVLPVQEARPALGMREEDWPKTPDGIAALLARMAQVEPGWLSADDEAAFRADLQAQKDFEKATSCGHSPSGRRKSSAGSLPHFGGRDGR